MMKLRLKGLRFGQGIVMLFGEILSKSRGHWIRWDNCRELWIYIEDGHIYDDSKICPECKISHVPHGPDACLGMKPGVTSMCCGHGGRQASIYMTTKRLTA